MKHLKRMFEKVEDDKVEIMNLLSEIIDEFDGLEMEDITHRWGKDHPRLIIKIIGFEEILKKFGEPTDLKYLNTIKKIIDVIITSGNRIEQSTDYKVNIYGIKDLLKLRTTFDDYDDDDDDDVDVTFFIVEK